VEIFELENKKVLEKWLPPEPPSYRGMHGINIPKGEGIPAE
jgi:hypothetical protein